jgi:hypothetical protein
MGHPTLTLRRAGDFTLAVYGSSHCGVIEPGKPAIVPCSYSLTLECYAHGLDDQGFLVEQIGIHTYFNTLPPSSLSCELFCVKCAHELVEKIRAENPRAAIRRVSLEIAPKPKHAPGSAGMTYIWDLES